MLQVLHFIRRYSFVLIILWMGLYAFDLLDDLRFNYIHRSPSAVAWMLVSDFIRCLLVLGIWVASNFHPDKGSSE